VSAVVQVHHRLTAVPRMPCTPCIPCMPCTWRRTHAACMHGTASQLHCEHEGRSMRHEPCNTSQAASCSPMHALYSSPATTALMQ
jgi:hypothetical protein